MNRRKLFNYDIVSLIELIEMRPCIWDKSHKHHKNKIKKQKAWREIYRSLDKNYDKVDEKKQKEISEAITTKWVYLRDAFMKSLRTAAAEGTKKKYIYYDQLAFLFKNGDLGQMDVTQSGAESMTPPENEIKECETTSLDSSQVEQRTASVNQRGKRKLDTVEREILCVTQETDEDDAFFKSIKPAVTRMTEDDKYEFRMGVMRLIQQIKKRSQCSSPSLSMLTSISHSNCSGPSQPLIKQYAPGNLPDNESPNNLGAERYNYMILPIKKTEDDIEETANKMYEESDVSEM